MIHFARLVIRNEIDVFGGPSTGTTYDLTSACPTCGTGAEQKGPLFLSKARVPKHELFTTLTHELIASPRLEALLREIGFSSFGEVFDSRTRRRLPLSQILPQSTLPPFAPGTTGFTRYRPCPDCRRDGFFDDPESSIIIRYEAVPEALRAQELLATFERFGNSALRRPFEDSVFASPLYIAGGRLLKVLETNDIKGVDREPVVLT